MISKMMRLLPKYFSSLRTSVRLYGTKEEYEAAFEKKYLEQNILTASFSRIGWLRAAALTKKLRKKKISPNNLILTPRLQDIRVISAGIQNVVSTAELVSFLRNTLSGDNIRLITFFIVPESKSIYIEGMRESLTDTKYSFGSSERLNFNLPGKIIDRGAMINKNMSSQYCNVVNGCRTNDEVAASGKMGRRFLFFGASEIFGTSLVDSETIPAHYQALLGSNSSSACVNFGMGGVNFIDVVSRVLKTSRSASDTIFLAVPYSDSMSHVDLLITLDESDMFDYSHPNSSGAKKVATLLFNHMQGDQAPFNHMQGNQAPDLTDPVKDEVCKSCMDLYQTHMNACEALEFNNGALRKDLEYFEAARDEYVSAKMTVGSVAVNCNPITLGHEHLIDYARGKVDVLFVLVIEEDSSAVSYKDRHELVSMVCKNKPNVFVLRGGAFVCTEYISPEYFIKDDVKSEVADFSLESFYFGQYIAPALGVQKIFLGDEPKCAITKQYNYHMQQAMPAYGIDLEIIPRIGNAKGDVISASYVRRLIRDEEFDQLCNHVPLICIPYLSSPDFKLRSDDSLQS